MSFNWKGKEIVTNGDILDALCALTTKEDGAAFMLAYQSVNGYARENVGYLMGYCDGSTAGRIYDLTATTHPVFGRFDKNPPTPEEAFKAGQDMAEAALPQQGVPQ